jgi:hypothetical protein
MIDRVDRVQMAVADAGKAAETFNLLLGAEVAGKDISGYLNARRTIMALGESEIELCEPDGAGIAAAFMAERGEGLMSAGFSTSNPSGLRKRLEGLGIAPQMDGEQVYLSPEQTYGMRVVISPSIPRHRVGPVSFLYEVTNTLVSGWGQVAAFYSGLFGLDPGRFSYISSDRFGYKGTLTLFNPPDRLDRIELSQVTDTRSAMGRWGHKHGDSLYMCYCETHEVENIISRLENAGARWTPRSEPKEKEKNGLWVHPGALHGLLLGVSRTTLAWEWSGRPDLVRPVP